MVDFSFRDLISRRRRDELIATENLPLPVAGRNRNEGLLKLSEQLLKIFDDSPGRLAPPQGKRMRSPVIPPKTALSVEWAISKDSIQRFSVEMDGRSAPAGARILFGFLENAGLMSETQRSGNLKNPDHRYFTAVAPDAKALDDFSHALMAHLNERKDDQALLVQSVKSGNKMKNNLANTKIFTDYRFRPEENALSVIFRVRTEDEALVAKLMEIPGAYSRDVPEKWMDLDSRTHHGGSEITFDARQAEVMEKLFFPEAPPQKWLLPQYTLPDDQKGR